MGLSSGHGAQPARYWHALDDGRVQCDLCPRRCRLRDGQRGYCMVRERRGTGLVLSAYGWVGALAVDPVEKKPLFHFLPGHCALSFATGGCNLGCLYCQNAELSRFWPTDIPGELTSPGEIAEAAVALACPVVAFTYSEPVPAFEYVVDVAEACHAVGIRTAAITAGYILPAPRAELFSHMDAANVDLKGSQGAYARLCAADAGPVLETLEYLHWETSVWLEVTYLLVPAENDSEIDVGRQCEWILGHLGPDVPVHMTAFHPAWKMQDWLPTPPETVRRARRIARAAGIRHVYTGNIHDPEGQSTYCAGCGRVLIGRDGNRISGWAIGRGRCRWCGTACPGVFDQAPGPWRRATLPVMLGDP